MEKECNDFNESLALWEAFELFVADVLKWEWRTYTKNPDKYGIDLLWSAWNIEVKLDTKGDHTGNHYFEVTCGKIPSGIMKYPTMKYFVIWTYKKFYLLEAKEMKDMILMHWTGLYGWDYMKSFWYTVEKTIVAKHARFIYTDDRIEV